MPETETMTEAELEQRIDQRIASTKSLDDIAKRLQERQAVAKPAITDPVVKDPGAALGGITELKVWDIPVGQAVVGGFVAVFASELVDGFLATQSVQIRGIVKLGAAGAAVKWGRGFLGGPGSMAVAILLAFDGIRDLVPIDLWAQRASGVVSGVVTQRGLVQGRNRGGTVPRAVSQAQKVADDYYAKLGGA